MPHAATDGDDLGLHDLRAAVPHAQARAPQISAWSVGMHVHHCCLSMHAIRDRLADSSSRAPWTWRSLIGRLVLRRGRLPRGRAQAPKVARPTADLSHEGLHAQLEDAEQAVADMRALEPERWIRHFALGTMRRDDAVRFIGIHNRHHLSIIRDILGASGTRQWQVPR